MVSTSKILTVSYGTFSCTLEGFDDSFDTMKAIAEYFRDLAADDRYFGAEPPTPDAEMLARIAEREISRRVEAHDQDGKIVLRAGALSDLSTPPPESEQRPAAPAPGATPAVSPARDTAEARAEPARAPQPEAEEEAETVEPPVRRRGGDSESIADKLRRIRAVATPAASGWETSEYGYTEDEHAQDFLGATAADLDAALAADDVNEPDAAAAPEPVGDSADSEREAIREESDATEPEAEPESVEQPAAHEATEQPVEETPEHGETSVEAEADDDEEDDADDVSIFAESGEDDRDADDETDADTLRALLDDTPEETPEDLDALMADDNQEVEDKLATDVARAEDDSDDEADDLEEDAFADDTLAQLMADALRDDETPAAPARETGGATPRAEAESGEGRMLEARVIKVKRSVVDAALAEGTLVESTDGASAASQDAAQEERTTPDLAEYAPLSDEDEAELQRELAEVEAELRGAHSTPQDAAMQPDSAADEDDDHDAPAAEDAAGDRAKRGARLGPIAADDQAPRIFEEADNQLEEPESNERRNAIQHLRAAVAATKAERSMGGEISDDVDDQPYRLDLESAVRPRRPQSVGGTGTARPQRTERPGKDQPAPLKLVAEQRIDRPAEPVRPRRISRADLRTAAEDTPKRDAAQSAQAHDAGFTAFAEEMGAHDLTDLLEAAAAYMADVEGRAEFSRPMLMHKLKEATAEEFSREEGLRSFGKLLREGKLQKLKGGRFAVTDETDFRPKARATG